MNPQYDIFCQSADAERDCSKCVVRQISVCSSLGEDELDRLRRAAQVVTYPKGKVIVRQDETLDHVYFVAHGLIVLYRVQNGGARGITGFLGPGDLLSGIKHREGAYCTARSITDVQMCGFERRIFLDLLREGSELGYGMLLTATDEIEALNDHIMLMARKSATERVAAFLLLFAHRWAGEGQSSITNIDLPVPRSDIGDYLGLTAETVSRAFGNLKKAGMISTPSRDKVVFNDMPALFDVANLHDAPVTRAGLGL